MTIDEKLNSTKNFEEVENAVKIFNELIKKVCTNSKRDKTFILLLMFILRNKKSSNDLILALFYTFL